MRGVDVSSADGQNWVAGPSITDDERLARVRSVLKESFVIVEHRFYCGSRAPEIFVADDYEQLRVYLQEKTKPGDSLWFWRYDELCRDDNPITHGKVPNEHGLVPEGGAY
jgi:hypothetical protein